jgi:indolepyruvate ferredoxin oxidoreductase, beta subunit
MKNKADIIFCGVGGQGTLLASEVISQVALDSGLDVKKAEVHGMAQRGGSVVSHVRISEKVYSPLIKTGGADYLVSFEQLETVRYLDLLKPNGQIIMNSQRIIPITAYIGDTPYPDDVLPMLKVKTTLIHVIDALDIAMKAGNKNTVNIVILGALSKIMDFSENAWEEALRKRVPAKFLDVNMKAFKLGRESAHGSATKSTEKTTRV